MTTLSSLDPARVGEDNGPQVTATISAVVALSTLFAAARLYVRIFIVRKFQFDDYMIVLSVICGWMSVGFSTAAVHSGNGRHIQTLTPEQIQGAIKFTLIGFVPGILSYVLPKLAVANLLARLLNPSRAHLTWLWSMCTFCLVSMMISVPIVFCQCLPPKSQWDFSVPAEVCYSKWIGVHYSEGASAFSAFVDFYLSAYPAVVLYKIQISTKKKIALSAALGVGSISTIVAAYKITRLKGLASLDFTFDSCDLTIWTIIEGSVIIIAACIPLLQPLLERVRNCAWSTKGDSRSTYLTPNSASGNRKGYADIELSSDKSRIGRTRRKFEMDSVLGTRNSDENFGALPSNGGSQDRILEEDEIELANTVPGAQTHGSSIPSEATKRIHRTDEISVIYAKDDGSGSQPHRQQEGWS